MPDDADGIVKIKQKHDCADLPLPRYMSVGASGMDLYAAVDGHVSIAPAQIMLISTGIYLSLPQGVEAQIRPRSGLALKHGIGMVNSPGTIDADYRGLINIILINFGAHPYVIKRGARIAQLVFSRVYRARLQPVVELDETARGTGGFGHTGV